jgi:hypothetical protein
MYNDEVKTDFYYGIVEYINDPAQLGRIRVRIPVLHRDKSITTEQLPWAWPCVPFGGGPGYGTFMVPPEGSTVFVLFVHGETTNVPVYIGMAYANPGHTVNMLRNNTGKLPAEDISMAPAGQYWEANPGPEPPREALIQSNSRPERLVVFKSVKGASIDVNDKDEDERLAIHDRAGQAMVFESNVTSDDNLNNVSARGLKSSYEGDSLPINSTLTNEGSVNIVDLGGQSITLHTKENNSRITLKSKETDVTTSTQKEVDGISTVTLDLASGEKRVNIEIKDKNEIKAKITLDGNTGYLEVLSPLLVKVNSKNILLNGNVTVDGNLTVTKNTFTLNDKLG